MAKSQDVLDENLLELRNAGLKREREFYDYWKKGVAIAGYEFFGDGTKESFDNSNTKNDLRPDLVKVEAAIKKFSFSEIVFLVSIFSFYNDIKGAELCKRANVLSVGSLTALDKNKREIIAGLLINYSC